MEATKSSGRVATVERFGLHKLPSSGGDVRTQWTLGSLLHSRRDEELISMSPLRPKPTARLPGSLDSSGFSDHRSDKLEAPLFCRQITRSVLMLSTGQVPCDNQPAIL
ncbi:hypothetical protein FSOLCH5_001576 [Fusarium solani]